MMFIIHTVSWYLYALWKCNEKYYLTRLYTQISECECLLEDMNIQGSSLNSVIKVSGNCVPVQRGLSGYGDDSLTI